MVGARPSTLETGGPEGTGVRFGFIGLVVGSLALLSACGSDAPAPFATEQDDELAPETTDIPVEPFPETLPEPFIIRENEAAGAESQEPTTEVLYEIQPGDTLATIAEQFGTTTAAIQRLNGIADPSILQVGDILRIPVTSERVAATTDEDGLPIEEEELPGEPYTIQSGDTLIDIGVAFGIDYLEIAAHNNLTEFESENLQVGQVIIIPPLTDDETDSEAEEDVPSEPPG